MKSVSMKSVLKVLLLMLAVVAVLAAGAWIGVKLNKPIEIIKAPHPIVHEIIKIEIENHEAVEFQEMLINCKTVGKIISIDIEFTMQTENGSIDRNFRIGQSTFQEIHWSQETRK